MGGGGPQDPPHPRDLRSRSKQRALKIRSKNIPPVTGHGCGTALELVPVKRDKTLPESPGRRRIHDLSGAVFSFSVIPSEAKRNREPALSAAEGGNFRTWGRSGKRP